MGYTPDKANGAHIDRDTVRTINIVGLRTNSRDFDVWLDGQETPPEYIQAVEFLSGVSRIDNWVNKDTGKPETHLVIPHTR